MRTILNLFILLVAALAVAPSFVFASVGSLAMPGGRGAVAELPPIVNDALGVLRGLRDLIRNSAVLASSMTNYLEDQVIKHLFRTGSFTKPTVIAHALFTATPGESGGGTEVSGGSYARVDLPPLDANWAATSGGNGTTSNASAITYPAPTANWGVVTSTAQLDATTAGNMLTYGALTTSKTINNGDAAPAFAIGALTFQADN